VENDTMKKIGWVLGWAVPETWFASLVRKEFPDASHVFVVASSQALERLEASGPFDWVVGYSLGSLLLLNAPARAEQLGRVALLAPIFGFSREKNVGGRVALAQLRQLGRWLRSEPLGALADFYQRAGLDIPAPTEKPSREKADELLWGLERLECDVVKASMPTGWCAWCGADDPLLDAVRLREISPKTVVVPGGGHHPEALLRVFAEAAT
jgi:hypothetical protein